MSWQKMKDKKPICAGFYWFSVPGRKAQLVQVIEDFGVCKYRELRNRGPWFKLDAANHQIDWAAARAPRAVEFHETEEEE